MLLISVALAIAIVLGIGYLAPYLPFNHLLDGSFYQVVSIVVAIALSAFLNLPMLYMLSGSGDYKKGKYKDALAKFKKAYATGRLSVDMKIYCAYIFLKEGDKEASEKVFASLEGAKLTERQKYSLETNHAILLWKKGDTDGAIEKLKQLWEEENSVTVAGTLGALLLVKAQKTGDYSLAEEFCEKANEQFTYERTIMANLGEMYYCTGKTDEAIHTFEELMDCGTSAPAPYYYYALALLEAGRSEEAQEMLRVSLRQRFSHLSTVSKKTVRAKLDEITAE